jgi:hypothetical protein
MLQKNRFMDKNPKSLGYIIIGGLFAVYNELGFGYQEKIIIGNRTKASS